MCIFTGAVSHVGQTRLFARSDGDDEILVYAMLVAPLAPLAMVLPLPVPPGTAVGAVSWLDLSGYPSLFADLEAAFPLFRFGKGPSLHIVPAPAPLPVARVGRFIASFVPAHADFARLDPAFRIGDALWQALRPRYDGWSFAVFQLAASPHRTMAIPPFGLRFPRRDPSELFFPTLHVHRGDLPARAEFDHVLYLQTDDPDDEDERMDLAAWDAAATDTIDLRRAAGVVRPGRLWRQELIGARANEDVRIRFGTG